MAISKARKIAQILQKSWRFHNFLPWNMAIFLQIFQKVPLTVVPEIYYLKNKEKWPIFATKKKKTIYRKALPIYGLGIVWEDVLYCSLGWTSTHIDTMVKIPKSI